MKFGIIGPSEVEIMPFIDEMDIEKIENYNPLCVDMETASIAHVCYANEVPFLAIRSITDTECECGIEIFEDNCVSASMNSLDVLKVILTSID